MIEVHRHTDREQDMNSEIRKAWIETREEWHIEIHLYSVNRESTRETVGVASERGIQTERQTQRQTDRQTESDIKRESGERERREPSNSTDVFYVKKPIPNIDLLLGALTNCFVRSCPMRVSRRAESKAAVQEHMSYM